MRAAPRDDAGVAGVLVLALSGVLLTAAVLAAAVGGAAVARHRAASAADLAALAVAASAAEGASAACANGRRIATAGGAELVGCFLTGRRADVVAQVRPPGALGRLGQARVRARAGPVG